MKSRLIYFLVGAFGAIAISSANATPTTVFNDPYSGYVLCVNKSTKLVTYPARLNCPKGFKKLELGAQGADGAPGAPGLMQIRYAQSSSYDIVADGYIGSGGEMVRQVLLNIDGDSSRTSSGEGWVKYTANVSGFWSQSAKFGSLLQCYFQSPNDYANNSQSYWWGRSEEEYSSWNSINLFVTSQVISTSVDVYLVCRTSGSVKDLKAHLEAVPVQSIGTLTVRPNP